MNKINILGLNIDCLTIGQAVKLVDQFIGKNSPHQVVTINPEIIMSAINDYESKGIINHAELVIPDGTGLIWAAKITKQKLIDRVTGIDLLEKICHLAAKKDYPVFFLGGVKDVAKNTSEILARKYPGLIIAGYSDFNPKLDINPYRVFKKQSDIKIGLIDPNLKIIEKIKKSNTKILFVAYGHPKQEKFIGRYKKILNIPVMMGVGGSFDFICKKSIRAPKILQNLSLEWLWRLITEPWRYKRIYTAVIKFPITVIINKFNKKYS